MDIGFMEYDGMAYLARLTSIYSSAFGSVCEIDK